MSNPVIIIPARWGSSRFAGKPLTALLTAPDGTNQPLLWWSYQAALKVLPTTQVWIATDDVRIIEAARSYGAQAVMTSVDCRNGTERIYEAANKLNLSDETIIVNLQGDAPLTPPDFIAALIDTLIADPSVSVATPALRCDKAALERFRDQRARGLVGGTTLVKAANGDALYFSKEVLPFADQITGQEVSIPVFHHVGLYAYRRPALAHYMNLNEGALEKIEGLEQLRFLENNIPVRCVEVEAAGRAFWEVNNPEDIALVSKDL